MNKLAPLVLALAVVGTARAQFLPAFQRDKRFPLHLELSGDWYKVRTGNRPHRMRTNHNLASIRLTFTNSRRVGLRWRTDFLQFPTVLDGAYSWRLIRQGTPGPIVHAQPIERQTILTSLLDPSVQYTLEVLTTILPVPVPFPGDNQIERYRDNAGLQGRFFELDGIVLDDGAITLPTAPPQPILECIILGDSLSDGQVPLVPQSPYNPRGALAGWTVKAIQLAASLLSTPRTPRIINHSFFGWYGCGLEFPYQGFPDEQSLRQARPWHHPNFADIFYRSHLSTPAFATTNVELVVYELAQNDISTGRLANPTAYVQDIIDNVQRVRTRWPAAKVLVAATHLDSPNGLTQRQLMLNAMLALGYRTDPNLDFVDTGQILSSLGVPSQPNHPLEAVHDIWAIIIGQRLALFLE